MKTKIKPEIDRFQVGYTFKVGQWHYKVMTRDGFCAIAGQMDRLGNQKALEVVTLNILPAWTSPEGKNFPTCTSWPRSEQWGTSAFTCLDMKSALKRFKQLKGQENER